MVTTLLPLVSFTVNFTRTLPVKLVAGVTTTSAPLAVTFVTEAVEALVYLGCEIHA